MERPLNNKFIVGAVVVVPFPFSDLTSNKRRPALIVATPEGKEVVLCQITSVQKTGKWTRAIDEDAYEEGGLPLRSYVRIEKLFTADTTIIIYKAGTLKRLITIDVLEQLRELFSEP